jgi:hypothetical protein
VGPFYPEDLPADWRLDFYANEFAIVVVPGDVVSSLRGPWLRRWEEELPSEFGFLIEPPVALTGGVSPKASRELLESLAAIEARLRGFLWPVHASSPQALASFRDAGAQALAPLHLLGEPAGPGWEQAAEGVGRVWLPDVPGSGRIDGPAIIDAGLSLAALRAAVERYLDAGPAGTPRLILSGHPPDPTRLREARSMLELMGL